MVGGSGPKMKGPEGHAAVFYLEPKVARRSNLGGGGEDKLERRVSRKIDTEGNVEGRALVERTNSLMTRTTHRHAQMSMTMKS
jgi:hypothetical protein